MQLYQQSQQQDPLDPYITHVSPADYSSHLSEAISIRNFCLNCGAENKTRQKYCVHCDNNLTISPSISQT
jgi:hypothetical protein